jgi:uncharacterized protein YjcR
MGAPFGNQNAVTHGRYSMAVRAAEEAAERERVRQHQAWLASRPKTDYGAIIDALKQQRRRVGAFR